MATVPDSSAFPSTTFSDYRIHAIFLDRAEAESFIGGAPQKDGPEIEEWPIGAPENELPFRMVWASQIDADGSIKTYDYLQPRLKQVPRDWSESCHYEDGSSIWANSAVSQEHANKLAVEERQKWLREKAGV